MLVSTMMPATYPYTLILGPALTIILAVNIALLVKFPSLRLRVGAAMAVIGMVELFYVPVWASWVYLVGLGTLILGMVFCIYMLLPQDQRAKTGLSLTILRAGKRNALRKTAYALLAMVIVVSGLVIFARTTNIVHEQFLETYNSGSTPNLTLRGVITEVRFSYEVNNGFSYHIFPAYIVMDVKEFVWGSGVWENQTAATDYWLNEAKTVVVYYEKTEVLDLTVGKRIEVKGHYNLWMEDSLYSEKLVVAPSIDGSYIKPL